MKIDKLQGYPLSMRNTSHAQNRKDVAGGYSSTPSFSGNLSFADRFFPLKLSDSAKELLEYFPKGERKAYEWMNRLGDWAKGEAAGIGITAIGTGLVAPWPIAYNPIVNHQLKKRNATPDEVEEKHKTQKYSAWRQPVSAVLAVIFQLGVQKPIERVLQYMTNNPDTIFNGTVYNQSFLNDEDFLEREVKKELNTKDKAAIKAEKTARLNAQINEAANALKAIKEGDAQIKVGKNIIPTDAVAQALNNQIEDYITYAKSLQKPENGKKGLSYYAGRAQDLVDNEDTLRKILSPENLEENIQRITSENPKLKRPAALRQFIKEQRELYVNKNSGMVGIFDHILNKQDSVIESSCARNLERIDMVKKACGGTFDMGTYYKFLKDSNQEISTRIAQLQDLLTSKEEWTTIKPAELKAKIEEIIRICHYDRNDANLRNLFNDKGVFISNKDKLKGIIYEDIIKKGYREVVKQQYKIFSQITKASVATFIMLPITCTALNWVYPRFMDIFLPNLSKAKNKALKPEQNGGAN